MSTAMTLTDQGQFTFTQPLLAHLNIRAGERIRVKKLPDASLQITAEKKPLDIMRLAGSLHDKTDVRLSDDQLQAAIANAYAQSGVQGLR